MNIEDRTEQCRSCKLEVPWGTCNDDGYCIECASLRPMQRFTLREVQKAEEVDETWRIAVALIAAVVVIGVLLAILL